MANRKVLSYGDVLLRSDDVKLLSGPYWLNDNIIEFYFEYLSKERVADPQKMLLVGPSVTFWIMHCGGGEALEQTIQPLDLADRAMVLLALNDNESVATAEGGCHWSLLVFNRKMLEFQHYDSAGKCNWKVAQVLFEALKPHLGEDAKGCRLIAQPTPQQLNGYDCGMYVLAICHMLCDVVAEYGLSETRSLGEVIKEKVTSNFVGKMRQDILQKIRVLTKSSE